MDVFNCAVIMERCCCFFVLFKAAVLKRDDTDDYLERLAQKLSESGL